jgi:23S rRNA pseudouridine955/2504/2580 synthase
MRSLTVEEKHSDMRIDRYLSTVFPRLPFSALQKALRKRDIKVDGKRVRQDYVVTGGEKLEIFIVDEILEGRREKDGGKLNRGFDIVYEDRNLLLVNKEQGLPVHPDRDSSAFTLIGAVRSYLAEKGEYSPEEPSSFAPALCHRLDRNTGGLVMIAKNQASLDIILEKMESREIRKFYQCLVKGRMEKKSARLKAYLIKDENKSRVFISDVKKPGAVEIITKYREIIYMPGPDVSRLEVELVTGRTHQIRAHLAHTGHPVIGDGKYGTNAVNRPFGLKYQALWAYKIVFEIENAGILAYLKGREFTAEPEFPF